MNSHSDRNMKILGLLSFTWAHQGVRSGYMDAHIPNTQVVRHNVFEAIRSAFEFDEPR